MFGDGVRPTICLSMIVRNESHVVTEALDSVLDLLDTWSIVDTGSTDETVDLIGRYFARHDLPGELHQRPWVDFGHNRTEALELACGLADYLLVLDADDLLVGRPDLSDLWADAYELRYGPDFVYWRPQLFRSDRAWAYEGAVHEAAVCRDGPVRVERLGGDYHLVSRRLGDRNRRGDKHRLDRALLEEAVAQDPTDARSLFYLAQTLYDAGELAEAHDRYGERIDLGGWEEEVAYAALQRGRCLERLGRDDDAVLEYLDAWERRPTRAEPLCELARFHRERSRWPLAHLYAERAATIDFPDRDQLFVAADVYDWRALDELAVSAYYVGRPVDSVTGCGALLDGGHLPESERPRVEDNRSLAVVAALDELRVRPDVVIADLVARRRGGGAAVEADGVTLTITTCRRPDLFERTMHTFLRGCLDAHRIVRWICIDDGSDDGDRARMAEAFPFFEFVWKEPQQRGHASSLDRLASMVDTPWWFHLEDDWELVEPLPLIGRLQSVLVADPSLDQVLCNPNYAETLDDRERLGGSEPACTPDGVRYLRHVHAAPGTPDYDRAVAALAPGRAHNIWWPHFSLRPSLLRTEAVRSLVPFDRAVGAEGFEQAAARRWTAAGRRSGFLDRVVALHTGRLTTQSRELGPPNAYDLNGQIQYGDEHA